jgi:hypothetical protein
MDRFLEPDGATSSVWFERTKTVRSLVYELGDVTTLLKTTNQHFQSFLPQFSSVFAMQ